MKSSRDLGRHASDRRAGAFEYYERLARLKAYAQKNLKADLGRDRAADVANMEPTAFSRFFRRNVGLTYNRWVRRLRVERAKELIRENNVPLGIVAAKVGFGSSRSLRRCFRRVEGCSPSEYRKSLGLGVGV